MASTYTELIKWLRSEADAAEREWVIDGIHECSVAKNLTAAADAIETLSSGINVYADEACKRAQECADLRRRIEELDELCATYCNERDDLRQRIEELIDKYAEKAADEPEVCVALKQDAPDVLYICDRRKCTDCHEECRHTKDWRHAKHFEIECGALWEQEG